MPDQVPDSAPRMEINLGSFLSRYVSFFLFAVHTTKAIQKAGEEIVRVHSQSLEDWLRSSIPPEVATQIGGRMETFIAQAKLEVGAEWTMAPRAYEEVVLNTSLVLEFTVFEMFLNHVVATILRKDPRTLQNVKPKMELDGKEIAKLAQGESFLDHVIEKIVREFDRDGFATKLGHLEEWFGLKENQFYDWSRLPQELQSQLNGLGKDYIRDIYTKRNEIVHGGKMVLHSGKGEDLNRANSFFKQASVNIAQSVSKKYDLKVDLFRAIEEAASAFRNTGGLDVAIEGKS